MAEVITKFEVRVKYTQVDPEKYKRTHRFSTQRNSFRADQFLSASEEVDHTRAVLRTDNSTRLQSIRCCDSVKEIEDAVTKGLTIFHALNQSYNREKG